MEPGIVMAVKEDKEEEDRKEVDEKDDEEGRKRESAIATVLYRCFIEVRRVPCVL